MSQKQVCGDCSNWEKDLAGSERHVCAVTGRDRSQETPCDAQGKFLALVHETLNQPKN